MKKLLLSLSLAIILLNIVSCKQNNIIDLSSYCGVWANANCELVQTNGYTMFFERQKDKIFVSLRKIENKKDAVYSKFVSGYLFDASTKKHEKVECPTDKQRVKLQDYMQLDKKGNLELLDRENPVSLQIVEKIEIESASKMPKANSFNIGESLQKWVMGAREYIMKPNEKWFEIGTNKHVYIFSANNQSVYCRAARQRSNNNGTVFIQNIRLMSNANEFTAHMDDDNYKTATEDVVIDDSLFSPDDCVLQATHDIGRYNRLLPIQ